RTGPLRPWTDCSRGTLGYNTAGLQPCFDGRRRIAGLAPDRTMELDPLLKFMTEKGASDLHLKPTRPPLLRINGKLLPLDATPLRPEELSEMLQGILTPPQKARLEEKLAVDIGYGVQGLARFRGNIYVQRGYYAAVFRRIPFKIKTLDELDLPPVMYEF